MWISVGRIVLDFYGNTESATKRQELQKLCDSLRKQFNLSALEVADFEDPERCVLGFAAACPEHWREEEVKRLGDRICQAIDNTAFARVTVEDTDTFYHGN